MPKTPSWLVTLRFGNQVGVEIGLILAVVVAAVQTAVLAMGLASRHDNDRDATYDTRPRA